MHIHTTFGRLLSPLGERAGEWEVEGRGRPLPPADLLPEWEHPDARFHEADAGRGRGRGRGRGAGGRGSRGGRGGGRGLGQHGPYGREASPPHSSAPAMERGWSQDEGFDDGGGGGFQEWSAYDESPPRAAAAPPRRAPAAGRGRPAGPLGPRGGGGRGPEQMGLPLGDPMDRRMPLPPHGGEPFDGDERPTRMRRREVGGLVGAPYFFCQNTTGVMSSELWCFRLVRVGFHSFIPRFYVTWTSLVVCTT